MGHGSLSPRSLAGGDHIIVGLFPFAPKHAFNMCRTMFSPYFGGCVGGVGGGSVGGAVGGAVVAVGGADGGAVGGADGGAVGGVGGGCVGAVGGGCVGGGDVH